LKSKASKRYVKPLLDECDECHTIKAETDDWWAIDNAWGSLFVMELRSWPDVVMEPTRGPYYLLCSDACVLKKIAGFLASRSTLGKSPGGAVER